MKPRDCVWMGLGIALVVLWYAAGREPEQVATPQAERPVSRDLPSIVLTAAMKGYEYGEKRGGWYELSNAVWNIMNTNGGGALAGATEQVPKPPFALKATNWFDEGVPGTNPIVGIPKTPHGKYCTSIGYKTGETTTNFAVILLGNGANTTNDHELVIKFLDGTELRHALPTNTVVDFRGFPGWQEVK